MDPRLILTRSINLFPPAVRALDIKNSPVVGMTKSSRRQESFTLAFEGTWPRSLEEGGPRSMRHRSGGWCRRQTLNPRAGVPAPSATAGGEKTPAPGGAPCRNNCSYYLHRSRRRELGFSHLLRTRTVPGRRAPCIANREVFRNTGRTFLVGEV